METRDVPRFMILLVFVALVALLSRLARRWRRRDGEVDELRRCSAGSPERHPRPPQARLHRIDPSERLVQDTFTQTGTFEFFLQDHPDVQGRMTIR
ncbi:MAG: hypothetical protein E6J15_04780 [Chloroflexi bacterium]|nr:MAG: hypothetical protein E6J15_04780 [Chloroflexota bacterium]